MPDNKKIDWNKVPVEGTAAQLGYQGAVAASFGNTDYGDSQYDTGNLPSSNIKGGDYKELRGLAQPWYDKAGNGLVNMAGRAITSGAEGILNPIIGSVYAVKDGKTSSFYDNPFTRTMQAADEQIKSTVPFYSTQAEDEAHGFEKLLYGNTYFRDVMDGIGYSLGAMATGGAYSKLFTAIGKMSQLGKAGEFIEKIKTIKGASDKLKYIDDINKTYKIGKGLQAGTIAGVGAMAESGANARADKDEFTKNMTNELEQSQGFSLTQGQKEYVAMLADEVGNSSFGLNMPIIMLDNWITFGKSVFGNKITDKVNLSGVVKEGFDDTYKLAKKSTVDKIISNTYGLRKGLAPMISEGFFQEQSQYGITKGVNDYYTKKYYNPEAADFIESFGKGVYQAYGTKEGWDNGIIGALSGGAMGNITTLATQGAAGFQDPTGANNAAAMKTLNSLSTKKTYQTLVDKAMRHGNLMNDQTQALNSNDTFTYENAKNDDFINYSFAKVQNGKTEDLIKELEQFKNMSEEDFKTTFGTTLSTDEITQHKQTVSQFITDKINKVKAVDRANNIINERFPDASEANKERLAYSSLTIDNSKERKISLNKEVKKLLEKNIHFSNEGTNPLMLMGHDYLALSEENKILYKDALSKAGMNPMDLQEALDKIADIDKLQERENQFSEEYRALMKEDTQAANDKADKEAQDKINKTKAKPPGAATVDAETEEEYEEEDEEGGEDDDGSNVLSPEDYDNLINSAKSAKEVEEILVEATKAGHDINMFKQTADAKKASFNTNASALNHTPVVAPVVTTPVTTAPTGQDAQQMYPNTKTVALSAVLANAERERIAQGGVLMTSKQVQELVDAFSQDGKDINDHITIDAVEYDSKNNKNKNAELEALKKPIKGQTTTFDNFSKVDSEIERLKDKYNFRKKALLEQTEDINYVEEKYGKSFEEWIPKEIKYLKENKSNLLVDIRNEEAKDYHGLKLIQEYNEEVKKINNKYNKSIRIKIDNHVIGYFQQDAKHTAEIQKAIKGLKIGDNLTNAEVKKLGLGLTISNGYIKSSNTVHTLDELNSIIKTGKGYVIFDQGSTSHRRKGGEPSLITTAILPGDAGSTLPHGYRNLGRYVLAFQDKSGNWKYIPISPSLSKENTYNTYLNKLRANTKKVSGLSKEQVDELNDKTNEKVFISIPKAQLKGRSLEVYMDINPNNGNIRTSVYSIDNGKLSDKAVAIVEIDASTLASNKDNNVLLDSINNALKPKIGITITPDSFRNSIPKGELKGDVSTKFQTYIDPNVLHGQDVLITVNKQAGDLNSTPTIATSTPMSNVVIAPTQTLSKEEQIAAAKAARLTAKQGTIDPNNAAYKLSDKQADELIDSQELEEVQRIIPRTIPVEVREDLRTFLGHFSQSTTPWGVFKNGVIHLWNEAGVGTGYHEAFHSIFRMAISNKEVDRLLKIAEKEFGKPTAKEILDIKTSTIAYMNLTNQQLSDLVLEEKMADKFMEWKKDNAAPVNIGMKALFRRLWAMIKELVGMDDKLTNFFDKINTGAFRSSKTIPNKQAFVTDQVFKNLLSGENQAMSSTKSKQMINTFAARVKQLSRGWNGLTGELPSNNDFLDQLIQERIDALMTHGYDNAYSQENEEDKTKMIAAIEEELFTLENPEGRDLFVEQVNKSLKLFSVDKQGGEEQERDGEDGTVERFGSSEAWTMSIEESTNKVVREYIAFAMYEVTDELTGQKVLIAVDNKVIYNGLGHILANIPEDQMMKRFIDYSKDNVQAKAVLDMIMSDTGMTYDDNGLITSPTKNINDIRRIITAFKNVKIAFMHTEFNPVFNAQGVLVSNEVKVYNANRNTANKITINNWVNALLNIKKTDNPTAEEWSTKVNKAVKSFKINGDEKLSNDEITAQVESIQKAFVPLGINLSAGYVRYSLLSYKYSHEAITDDQLGYLASFEEIVPMDLDVLDQGEYSIKSFLMEGKDMYAGGEEGMSSKLDTIATNNSAFDESIATSNFKGADNNTRHDLIKSSYVLDETLKLRSPDYRNSLVENYEILKDNMLFKFDKLMNGLKINLIDGVRDHSTTDSEGKVFGDFSEREYLMQHIGYWFGQKNNKFFTLFRQNEASNTAYQAELPVQNYIDENGGTNDSAIEHVYNSFTGEYKRIGREKAKGLGNIKGYNDKETGRAFRFTEFVNLLGTIGPAKYNDLVQSARAGIEISEEVEKAVKAAIKRNLTNEIKEFKNILAANNLVKTKDGKIVVNLLLPNNIGEKKLSNEELDKSISDFYINDYINSFALNQMFDGDYALSRDDKGVKEVTIDGIVVEVPKVEIGIDIVKRNKGAMGSGSDMGPGTHRIAYIKDINTFVTKEDGKLVRGDKGDKINSNDAQSYTNINHILFMATRLGRASTDVITILRKIRRGIAITNQEQETLESSQVSLNPWKTVTFGREFYIKTSEAVIDRHEVSYIDDADKAYYNELMGEIESMEDRKEYDREFMISMNKELMTLYKPLPGKEHYHRILNQMDTHGIDQVVAESASKGMTIDPQDSNSDDLDLSKSMIDIPNSYKRLQVETPTGKTVITDGTQLMQLIDSEQVDETPVMFKGESTNVGDLRKQYRSAMASTRDNAFKMAKSYITEVTGAPSDVTKLKVKFLKALESSGADEQLLQIFELNWNLLPAIDKAEQLFLSHFGSGVLAQKVPGTKVSLMSDAHWNIVIGEDGEVVLNKEVKRDPSYFADHKTRKLLHNTTDPKTGQVYSECVLSERVFSKFGLNIGDEIPVEVATMLGYRIPTQDKHSMMSLRVVDVLPNHLEGTGIFPAEIVLLSGADFDIDSLFIHQPAFWIDENKKAIKAGTEKTSKEKWNGFLAYIKKDKLFKSEYEDRLKNNFDYSELTKIKKKDRTEADNVIIANEKEKTFQSTLEHFKLPTNEQDYSKTENLNSDALNNEILEAKLGLLTNEAMRDIALTPVSSEPIVDEANYIEDLKGETVKATYSASSLLGKAKSFFQNSAGKMGIGPVANALQAFTFVAKNNLLRAGNLIKIDNQEYNHFNYLTSTGQRIADTLSTILSVMTDNAKDPLAGKMGLSLEILTPYNYLVSLGVPLRTITKIINTPAIQMYAAYLKENEYKLKSATESKKGNRSERLIKFFDEKLGVKDVDLAELQEQLAGAEIDTSGLEGIIKSGVINDANRDVNVLMLVKFLQIEEEARNFQDLNNLIKLTKGLPTSFVDVDKGMVESIYNLRLESLFGLPKREKQADPAINVYEAVEKDQLLYSNIKKALEIQQYAKGIFITETEQFKNQFELLTLNLKEGLSKDDTKELKRNFLGYITTRAYIDWMKSKPVNPIPGFNPGNDALLFPELTGDTLAKQLIILQNSENKNISKNAFITWLKPELKFNEKDEQNNKKLVFDKVSGKSFIKLSVESIDDIVGAYKDLFNNEETREFALNAFNYLISKDNLEYKNDSFIKYIAPFIFNNVSKGLDIKMKDLISYTPGFKESAKEFRKILSGYTPTQKKFVKAVKIEELPTNATSITILSKVAKKAFESKTKMVDGAPYTEYKFPEFIRVKIGNEWKLYYSDLKGQTENWGMTAVYIAQPPFGYVSISPFSKTYKENLDTYQKLKDLKVKETPVELTPEEGHVDEQAQSIDFDGMNEQRMVQVPAETEAIPISSLFEEETKPGEKLDISEKTPILPEGITQEDIKKIPDCP